MRNFVLAGFAVCVSVAAFVLVAHTTSAQEPAPPTPACIHTSTTARFRGYGYDHVVRIENTCAKAASCEVSTNSAPKPVHADVPAGGESEIVAFRGSPAREFTANVNCTVDEKR